MTNPFKASYTKVDNTHKLTLGVGYAIIAVTVIVYGVFKLTTR